MGRTLLFDLGMQFLGTAKQQAYTADSHFCYVPAMLTFLGPGNRWFNDFLVDQHYKSFWYSMRSFYDGDGYISLPLYFRFFDVAVSPAPNPPPPGDASLNLITFMADTDIHSLSIFSEGLRNCFFRRPSLWRGGNKPEERARDTDECGM